MTDKYPCNMCNMDDGSPLCLQDSRCPRIKSSSKAMTDKLPPLKPSDHPEPRIMQWSKLEMEFIQDYARKSVREAVPEALRKEAGVLAGAKLREKHADIRHYLQEAHGFASMSPRGKEDIATALEILDELEAEVLSLIAAAKESDK